MSDTRTSSLRPHALVSGHLGVLYIVLGHLVVAVYILGVRGGGVVERTCI